MVSVLNETPFSATMPTDGGSVKRQTKGKTMRAPLVVRYET